MGMFLSGRALANHAQGPGFDPQHCIKKKKKKDKTRRIKEGRWCLLGKEIHIGKTLDIVGLMLENT
jgi:hypothetical protein